jgi:hypothetical protein
MLHIVYNDILWHQSIPSLTILLHYSVRTALAHFQEILSRAHGNYEEQNKIMQLSIIIINYCIIFINTIITKLIH